jgi:hypothetical protein
MLCRDLSDVCAGGVGATQRATDEMHATKTHIVVWTHAQMFAAARPQCTPGNIQRHAYFSGSQSSVRISRQQVLKPRHEGRVSGHRVVIRNHRPSGQASNDGIDQLVFQSSRRF